MNKKINSSLRKVLILGAIFFSIYMIGLSYINSHEFNHMQIYNRYNVKVYSEIDYTTLSGKTIPLENIENCNDFCKLSHSLNDIISYNLVVFIFNSWALLLAYLLLKENEIHNKN